MNVTEPDLLARWVALRANEPRLRIRDAALALGVPEHALVLLDPRTVRLRTEPAELLRMLPLVGRAMALTRNASCVHERHGAWSPPDLMPWGRVATVVGPDIDLRLFLGHWVHLVATIVDGGHGPLPSLQAFDAAGAAVHKIYATDETDLTAWEALVVSLADADPPAITYLTPPPLAADRPDEEVDVETLRARWMALRDTHEFHPLLAQLRVGRLQAVRLAGAPFARQVERVSVELALRTSAEAGRPIMVFVGNPGCIQIHTGRVERVIVRGKWLNVLDDTFNLHLDTEAIASVWHVVKPTADGPVHSLEVFASDGTLIAQLFGARKPGQPEDPSWTGRVAALPGV